MPVCLEQSPAVDHSPLTLETVYTALDTKTTEDEPGAEKRKPNEKGKPLSVLSAVARHPVVVLKGDQSDALRYLVDKTTVDKVRPVIRACLDAFIAAETQPDARPVALQLSAALRTQATGVANTLPWVLLFHSVQGVRDE